MQPSQIDLNHFSQCYISCRNQSSDSDGKASEWVPYEIQYWAEMG